MPGGSVKKNSVNKAKVFEGGLLMWLCQAHFTVYRAYIVRHIYSMCYTYIPHTIAYIVLFLYFFYTIFLLGQLKVFAAFSKLVMLFDYWLKVAQFDVPHKIQCAALALLLPHTHTLPALSTRCRLNKARQIRIDLKRNDVARRVKLFYMRRQQQNNGTTFGQGRG